MVKLQFPQIQVPAIRTKFSSCVILLVMILIQIVLYAPLVGLPVRSFDQLSYYAERISKPGIYEGLKLADYSFERTYSCGYDTALYRPLVFVVHAVLYELFPYQFRQLNVISIVLHILVTCLLFRILRRHLRGMAVFFVLLFSSSPPVMLFMVGDIHFIPYLLGMLLLLIGLDQALDSSNHSKVLTNKALFAVLALSVSVFLNEIYLLACFFIFLFVRRKAHPLSPYRFFFLLPLFIYGGAYLIRFFQHINVNFTTSNTSIWDALRSVDFQAHVIDVFETWKYWVKQYGLNQHYHPPHYLKFISLVVFVFFASCWDAEILKKRRWEIALWSCLLLGHSFLLSYYRFLAPPHHFYFWALFMLGLVSSLVHWPWEVSSKKRLFCVFMCAVTCFSFFSSYRRLLDERAKDKEIYLALKNIEDFISRHEREADFSISVEAANLSSDDTFVFEHGCDGDLKPVFFSFSLYELLYARYYKKSCPKWHLIIQTGNEIEISQCGRRNGAALATNV